MEIESPKIKELAIRKIPIFTSLTEEERTSLGQKLSLREYKKGTSIIVSDHSDREMMFVADGAVDIKRTSFDGKEVIISRLGIGDFFGEIALLTQSSRSADVTAVEDCMILVLNPESFEYLLANQPNFSKALLVELANRVVVASTKISDLALLDVYYRVLRTLSRLAKKDEKTGKLVVQSRPTHKDLAAMVGSSREMVTRALSRLEEEETIQVDGEKIYLLSAPVNL